jgi:Rrf2 family transcriptional regulator, nitric oxide-sensitive transcriptional repressor
MLSQTVEYALRAMTHLAAQPPEQTESSEAIAEKTKVPKNYLSKVMRDLVLAELVTSQRGPNGGFALTRPPERITILDVVNAVDPIKRIATCPLGNPAHLRLCPLHRRMDDALGLVEKEFAKTTLCELLETAAQASGTCRKMGPNSASKRSST